MTATTSHRRTLAGGTLWNLAGLVVPGVAAVLAIPLLIQGFGVSRYGVLTLVWLLVGYFGVFDLGLSRALTQMVAARLGKVGGAELAALVWTGLLLMLGMGVLGGALLAAFAGPLSSGVLKVPVELMGETSATLWMVALAVPAVTVSAGLRGVLEARQDFAGISVIRIVMGVLTYVGPVLTALRWPSLGPAVLSIVVARYLALFAHLALCLRAFPELGAGIGIRRDLVGPLFKFGGWMSVSNIVSPIMANMDRFLLGVLLSVSAVAFYATPHEVITKLNIIPGALSTVLFPLFARGFTEDRRGLADLFSKGLAVTLGVMSGVCVVLVCFAEPLLSLWVGPAFAAQSVRVAQWLTIGALFNGLAAIPVALIHGAGRPEVTAKLHLVELPFYLLSFWLLTRANGVEGAAQAWCLRVTLDAGLLLWCARRILPELPWKGLHLPVMAAAGLLLLAALLFGSPIVRTLALVGSVVAVGMLLHAQLSGTGALRSARPLGGE